MNASVTLSLAIALITFCMFLRVIFAKLCPLPEFRGPRGSWEIYINLGHSSGSNTQSGTNPLTGPIYKLNLAGQRVLVIGTAKIASDLLERRSSIYSDRPRFIMASEILTGGMNLAFAQYNDQWKRMRRAASNGLSVSASEDYVQLQATEATSLLYHLLAGKKSVDAQLRRAAASTVLSVVYAYPPVAFDDNLVHRVENYVDRLLKAALPGNYLVDMIPVMIHLPLWLARWKDEGYSWFRKDTDMWLNLVDDVRLGLKSGERTDCLVSKLIDPAYPHNISEVETAWLAGMMFGAGAEAIAATLSFFILSMVLYPDVQQRLRDEIDSVVGNNQLPNFNDIRNLPFLGAVVKEVLRCPSSLHRGRRIHGSLNSSWDVNFYEHLDSSVYEKPDDFFPERFLADDGVTTIPYQDTRDLGHHSFGFGRRSCIGYPVAINALLINAASIVFAFNISKAKDANGNEITPDPNNLLDEGLAVRPIPFKCSIQPRSVEIRTLINDRYAVLQENAGMQGRPR